MSNSDLSLLKTRRFLPLFITQFAGAFNDNLFKQSLVIFITYSLATSTENVQLLVTAAAGIFMLPFFLFSATAGQVADKYNKSTLTRFIKLAEVVICIIAVTALISESVTLMMVVLFLLGTQSAFFGPIKYSILPEHLQENELIGGNGLIEAGTFLAILLGVILGGMLVRYDGGVIIISILLITCALIGFISSTYMPPAHPVDPALKINRNLFTETWKIIAYSAENRSVFLCILGISWFWLVGATLLSQFPNLAKSVLNADESVVTLFNTTFSIGIAIGSLWCNRLLKGKIHATYVPVSAIAMSLFMFDMYFATHHHWQVPTETLDAWALISSAAGLRILFDMVMLAVFGGLYIVPLYAIMQQRAERSHRSRVIASNNVVNALFMVFSAIIAGVLLGTGFTIPQLFLMLAAVNLVAAFIICGLLPDAIMRSAVRWLLKAIYRVEVKGLEHYDQAGDRVLIIANHTSFLDAALIAAFLPETVTFAVNTHIARKWWMKPALALVNTFALDPTNPMATKSMIDKVKKNTKCMIFPEGRITVTGTLMKVYEGPGMIADKSGAMVLPIRIDGAQYTHFSRLKGKVRLRLFPKITLTILPPRKFEAHTELKGRARRQFIGLKLYDVMAAMMFESSDYKRGLFDGILNARAIHGDKHVIVEDVERNPLTYRQLIARCFILGSALSRMTARGEFVGVLLPNMVNTIVTFFALQAYGRVPAMLNFSTGAANMSSACTTAQIKTVLTSRRFVEAAGLADAVKIIQLSDTKVVFLEDLKPSLSLFTKIKGVIGSWFPELYYRLIGRVAPSAPAVILFTSGSEGAPKGVVLSHLNISANASQLAARVDFGPTDIVFNCLPVFHSFGLTGGTLLPVLSGIRTFFYPSPLHYRIVPEMIYDTNATIVFGTDTFLSGYARFAHPYDFHYVRYVFAGAEKLKEATRKLWAEKYGVRIFEGYGATETSPVIATNTPMQNKVGTVGRAMPGLEIGLDAVPGIDEGGKLWVKGPNVMLGYLLTENPGVIIAPNQGWYDTGDVVAIDEEGFISIKGRTKRFAKIGGEMVSLSAVEGYAADVWPNQMYAAVSLPDPKKGEQVILLTDAPGATREALLAYAKERGVSELFIPKKVISCAVPLLGTGKVDYVTAKKQAESASFELQ